MDSAEQLSRTLLLFQADFGLPDDGTVLQALSAPTISLVADARTVNTLSGQVAITTTAMLMARSGLKVFIDAPDTPLLGYQPPMKGATLHEAVSSVGAQLIDGVQVAIGCPLMPSDIAFVFGGGTAGIGVRARRIVSIGWTDWSAELVDWPRSVRSWNGNWPIGAMAAAVLATAEAIKIPGRTLARLSRHAAHFLERFAASGQANLSLAPESTPRASEVGDLDIISAGAVSNAFLYALFRIPGIAGSARAFDNDISEASNRNRNMLLLPGFVGQLKVALFHHFGLGLTIDPVPRHFTAADLPTLADRIAVGVDDIPTRWMLAGARAPWMGVGATSHFDSMASVHYPYSACAACLHPEDEEQEGPIPTIAVTSFLAGLMVAADLLRDVAGADVSLASRCRYLTPLQLAGAWSGPVAPTPKCPAHCPASRLRA